MPKCVQLSESLLSALGWPATGHAVTLTVEIDEVSSDAGNVLVAVCTPETFLRAGCPFVGKAPARQGAVDVVVEGIEPGVYAVQAFHDENDNLDLDRSFFGLPREGMGFSNDAPMRMGPPRFADAAIDIRGERLETRFRLRYFDSERSERALSPQRGEAFSVWRGGSRRCARARPEADRQPTPA